MDFKQLVAERLEWVSQFSRDPKGGLSRLLYKPDWVKTQHLIKDDYAAKGFKTYFDSVGNLFVRNQGKEDEVVLVGSHIDTVVNGGHLDGQFGVVAGLIAMDVLQKKYGQPKKTLEIVSMAEEEGSRFPFTFWGSKNIVGNPDQEVMQDMKDAEGVLFVDAMREAGFDFQSKENKPRKDLHKYVEIHIEQGNILETENKQIGVVTHIVGQKRFTITVDGQANHAGTTPMGYRKDALAASAEMMVFIREEALKAGDPMVATVGHVELKPNTSNVVPGKVIFTLDFRHTMEEDLEKFKKIVVEGLETIAKKHHVTVDLHQYMNGLPVPMCPSIVETIKNYCEKTKQNYRMMHSGAGHDAQIFAPVVPTGMIFVPSIKGISHNPAENTSLEDLAKGVEVLTDVLYELAYL